MNKQVVRIFTRNGAEVVPTGRVFTASGVRIAKAEKMHQHYVECQMLPIHPQRFERVLVDNLEERMS